MSSYFNKLLNVPGHGLKEFYFKPVCYGSDLYYTMSTLEVPDFRMKRDENSEWKIAAQVLPMWGLEMELELGDMIDNELDNPHGKYLRKFSEEADVLERFSY